MCKAVAFGRKEAGKSRMGKKARKQTQEKTWKKPIAASLALAAFLGIICLGGCSSLPGQADSSASEQSDASLPGQADSPASGQSDASLSGRTDSSASGQPSLSAQPEGGVQPEEAALKEACATLLVAAAASLKNVYEEELIPMFEERYPNILVEGTYDSSGKLQAQIEEGLEADVFMSAAAKQMDALEEKGMVVSETRVNLLENRIVLIVPSGSELGLSSFADIVKADAIALGDPASVPAGQYAKEALTFLGIWEEIQGRASFGTNVTEVLNQVAAASAEAGIVYATDAASMAGQVEIAAEAPEGSLSQRVLYPAAVLKGSAHLEEAGKFVEFLKTPEAMEVFAAYGFTDGGK